MLAQLAQIGREPASRGEGIGMVIAQDSTEAGEGVVLESECLLVLTQRSQGESEETGGPQGERVIVALRAAAAGQGVGLESVGPLVFA
jgi:hypothetical protein